MTALPVVLQALILIGGSMAFGFGGVLVGRRIVRGKVTEGHNDVLAPIFLMAGTVYAVLLAFLVIIVWEQYGSANDGITREASVLATMYRQTDAMPLATKQRLRQDLRRYTSGVIDQEFNVDAYGYDISDDARIALADMYKVFAEAPPDQINSAISDDFVRSISEVSVERSNRLIGSDEAIPWILWIPMVLGGAVVIAMTWFLFMERGWLHIAMVTTLSGLFGLMLFTAILLNHPYTGKLHVKSDALDGTMAVFDAVDNGK